MTDEYAIMMEAERLALYDGTLNQRGSNNTQYHHAVARHHTALTISGWKPVDPAMQKAKTVFHEAYEEWDNVSLKTTGEKIEAAASVIVEAYPEPERPSADMVSRATMRLKADHLNDATDNAIYRRILRQAEEAK